MPRFRGVDPTKIDVGVEDGTLTIKGEKKYEREKNEKGQYRTERSYGAFERSIALSADVDESKAKAEFKKGVLRLTLPKRPGAGIAQEENPGKLRTCHSKRSEAHRNAVE